MEKSNHFRFNLRRYEDQLSVFGRKVLNELVMKWNSNHSDPQKSQQNCRNISNSRNSIQSRRILTDDSPRPAQIISPPPLICHDINTDNDDITEISLLHRDDDIHVEHSLDINLNQNFRHCANIPTTSKLFQTFGTSDKAAACTDSSIADKNVSSHNLINPVIEGNIPIPNEIYNGMLNINDLSHTRKSSDKKTASRAGGANGVDWDNMFDNELFFAESAVENAQVVLGQIEAQDPNNFDIELPLEARKKTETKTKRKCDNLKDNGSKKMKRKNQLITDAMLNKVKKVPDESKISFRKQKYTKTVKNWLNDIDPVERNEDTDNNVETTCTNNTSQQAEIIIEKAKEKSNKKVVQALLANKNGTMKYKKPMKKHESEKTDESIFPDEDNIDKRVGTAEENMTEKINKDNIPKERKTDRNMSKVIKNKTKFVAPIKSQIPVKDVDFKITTVEDNITDDRMVTLSCTENQEVVLVLIYSNGFCQLNYHHTDDACDPEGFILSINDDFFYFKGDHQKHKETLQRFLEKNRIVCYEGKSVLIYLKCKLDLDAYKINIIDAKIGGSILDPDYPPENFYDLQKQISYTPQFTIATECTLQKAAWYATLLKECASKLVYLLVEEQLWNVFSNIEMKLLPIIAEMERRGVSIDLQKLKSMEDILLTKMKVTELECHKAAGKTFQINSPVQVRALIYDELKLDAKCNMKIRETLAHGAKSTSESMLRGLVSVHPLPRLILEYRHLHKAHATFLTGIAQHVKDGIVRPTWVQTAAATGRIASNNPNLQAIPKARFSLVLFPELSHADNTGREALSFRSVYTARAGRVLLACDFKHVECRVFAHAAADEPLLAALRSRGDLFRLLAHKWLNKPESDVTPEDRERTKRIVYASLYGAGVRKLMDILAVEYEQALAVHTSFNRTFPSLKAFGQGVVARCAGGARLVTLGGRARSFRNIASKEFALRAQAERQAVNFIVQGSAADLCKMAMVEACAQLRNHAPPLDARLLLQIHDELVWEVRRDHLDAAAVVIKRAMEGCGRQSGMEDILPVAVSVGSSWGEMREYHFN